ncbi:MAG TPA: response regulator transcription factor [Firmicutes bacterium]|nr:response regulator transcription factor [Bacillales bacterium]HJA40734.1 response regulator transcription factor [Bacillota bacterium]
MAHILLVEDEENLHSFLKLELEYEGYEVTVSENGKEALELFHRNQYDMVLLDLMLPGINGLEVCRRIREESMVPIIMLTARDTVMDRITGLQLGADDYLPKPFDTQELLARMKGIFRRIQYTQTNDAVQLTFKDLKLDIMSRQVMRGSNTIELTNKEFELLHVFMKNINRVLTRDILLEQVWGYEHVVETNVVDVYIRYLRNKLDENNKEEYIQTVRGVGYVMRQ